VESVLEMAVARAGGQVVLNPAEISIAMKVAKASARKLEGLG